MIGGDREPLVTAETGIVWVPVEHDGCAQSSEEEREAIRRSPTSCSAGTWWTDGIERAMTPRTSSIVAPFNLRYAACRDAGAGQPDRIGRQVPGTGGTGRDRLPLLVDAGRVARGAAFLLSPNRLNVAISRAQALAIVVGSPELPRVRCKTVEEMKLVNLLCHLVQYAEEQAATSAMSG